jgi:hypothetical protein
MYHGPETGRSLMGGETGHRIYSWHRIQIQWFVAFQSCPLCRESIHPDLILLLLGSRELNHTTYQNRVSNGVSLLPAFPLSSNWMLIRLISKKPKSGPTAR